MQGNRFRKMALLNKEVRLEFKFILTIYGQSGGGDKVIL